MGGYIGSKSSVTQVDGYTRAEADAEFVAKAGDTMTGDLIIVGTLDTDSVTDGTTSVPTGYVVNGSAKAWINFNGTGTVAIRDSFNVSSLTDGGVGNYALGLSNSFANINYSGAGSSWRTSVGFGFLSVISSTTAQFSVTTGNDGGSFSDNAENSAQTWGDLA